MKAQQLNQQNVQGDVDLIKSLSDAYNQRQGYQATIDKLTADNQAKDDQINAANEWSTRIILLSLDVIGVGFLAAAAACTLQRLPLDACVCGFIGAAGHYCATHSFRVTDISATQSVKFLDLVWASLLGYLLFDTSPAGWTVLGGMVILASTLWIARREARGT